MLDELHEAVANNRQAEIGELTEILKGNLAKIAEHGKRADGIVRGMLEHSRGSSGEQRLVELTHRSVIKTTFQLYKTVVSAIAGV